MSWDSKRSLEEVRAEFLERLANGGSTVSALSQEYGISRKTAYKWKGRQESGDTLSDKSRRPKNSPNATSDEMVASVLALREKHPFLGGAKISIMLKNQGLPNVPAGSTITEILRRHNLLDERAVAEARHILRFAKHEPNEMWQVDFKGHFPLENGERCHPLNAVDDCTRFALAASPLTAETFEAVRPVFLRIFQEYGLPWTLLCDNGNPWGVSQNHGITMFEAWLMELDVLVIHGRPLHPQTQGKEERFNKTWKRECLERLGPRPDFMDVLTESETFRDFYNNERPHMGIGGKTPSELYRKSERQYPQSVADWEYDEGETVKLVGEKGYIHWNGTHIYVGTGLRHKRIAVVESDTHPGCANLLFRNFKIGRINLERGELETLRAYRLHGDPRLER